MKTLADGTVVIERQLVWSAVEGFTHPAWADWFSTLVSTPARATTATEEVESDGHKHAPMLLSKLHKLMRRKAKNGEQDDLISAVVGYLPLEPMGIHRECTFARHLSPHSSIFKNSDYLAAQITQPRQTHANLVALCKCSYFGDCLLYTSPSPRDS